MPSWTRVDAHGAGDADKPMNADSTLPAGTRHRALLAVVLAAGAGTRLGRLTETRSKAMMPIVGQPMIERVLEMLATGGARRFIVVAHREDRELVAHLRRSSWADQTRLAYQDQRMGMVHALKCAAPLIRQEDVTSFLLSSCDSLYPEGHVARLVQRHRQDPRDATLTVMWTSPQAAASSALVVLQDGIVEDIIEKPSGRQIAERAPTSAPLTAPSLYALSTSILDHLHQVDASDRGEYEFPDALRFLIAAGGKVGVQVVRGRMTLTHPSDLLALNRHFLGADPTAPAVERVLPPGTVLVPPVRIEAGARLGGGCRIGPEVYLEHGCRVHGRGAVARSVVLRDGSVEPRHAVDGAVIGGGDKV